MVRRHRQRSSRGAMRRSSAELDNAVHTALRLIAQTSKRAFAIKHRRSGRYSSARVTGAKGKPSVRAGRKATDLQFGGSRAATEGYCCRGHGWRGTKGSGADPINRSQEDPCFTSSVVAPRTRRVSP